jgi:lysozyme
MPRGSRRPLLAAAAVALLTLISGSLGATQAVRAADPVEGIDVSHWQSPDGQPEIDWQQVAAAGKEFAFIKASQDVDFVDPWYVRNRARARVAGLMVGAYHFADPDPAPALAVASGRAQADHFLATADIASGDLPPVLDLERANGLAPPQLEAWSRAFLERVHERTGVRGVIYTSPNFWRNNLADTDWFATNGYRVLWIAHWTTSPNPTVPASDWAGFGWTFWQYTSKGTVAGIDGNVDLDRFDGGDLSSVAIELAGEGGDPPPPPFKDIASSTFKDDIAWLYASGITTGCSRTKFCPTTKVTRGQMATFLARALQLPKATKDYFRDDDGSTHEANINRLAKAGLTSGCSATRYCPDGAVSRGQLATFLARVLDLSATSNDYFVDDDASTHESNINRIARAGLTSGCDTDRYCPTGALTRGQMAAFLHSTFGY